MKAKTDTDEWTRRQVTWVGMQVEPLVSWRMERCSECYRNGTEQRGGVMWLWNIVLPWVLRAWLLCAELVGTPVLKEVCWRGWEREQDLWEFWGFLLSVLTFKVRASTNTFNECPGRGKA